MTSLFDIEPSKSKPQAITLRDYQQAAVDACWDALRTSSLNQCIVIPTAGGKTPIIATLCRDAVKLWEGRVLIISHVKELLEQAVDKLQAICPDVKVGVYSAGLGRRDRRQPVIVAGIQSVYSRAAELGHFDLILIDEAHLIPPSGDGMYRSFLADMKAINSNVRVIGLTATPYRLGAGRICSKENILNEACYEIGVRELIEAGYLSQLTSKRGLDCDTSGLHMRGGEFVESEAEQLMLDAVEPACHEIVTRTTGRKSVLVFCQSVAHAEKVADLLSEQEAWRAKESISLITGNTPAKERADTLAAFKAGEIKYLVNVLVLTTGFDAPNIDCVCLLRPTASAGLYYQMVGRGFRICEGKENCLVLDFGGNVRRHGPVDLIDTGNRPRRSGESSAPPTRVCPNCQEIMHAALLVCPGCGAEFEREPASHETKADNAPVTTLETIREEREVGQVRYSYHMSRTSGIPTLRVEYRLSFSEWISEWVCIEHDGFAGQKARQWWKKRSNDPFPESVDAALLVIEAGALAPVEKILVEHKGGEKYPRIKRAILGKKPEYEEVEASDEDVSRVPFDVPGEGGFEGFEEVPF